MKLLYFLFFLTIFTTSAYGQKADKTVDEKLQIDILSRLAYRYSTKTPKTTEKDHDFVGMDITSKAGNLANILGDYIYTIDSLVVRGTVDNSDIHTLWEASFNGRLSVINLENAEIENGIIPEDAFWHQKEQLDPSLEFVNTIHLRRIILPEGVKRIEEMAFKSCIYDLNGRKVTNPQKGSLYIKNGRKIFFVR